MLGTMELRHDANGAHLVAVDEAVALERGHEELHRIWERQDTHMEYLAWRRDRAEQVAQHLRGGERGGYLLSDTIRELEQNGYSRLQIRDGIRLWITS